tara:strand:- start:696 stop:839 length:144 start_codon:yes stop_codon:yes gene_type:complete
MKVGKYKLFSKETSEFSLDGGTVFSIILQIHYGKNRQIQIILIGLKW